MTAHDETLKRVESIFRKVLNQPELTLSDSTTAKDVQGWDSLTNMQLITAVEKDFGMKFAFSQVVKFKNVGDMVNALAIQRK